MTHASRRHSVTSLTSTTPTAHLDVQWDRRTWRQSWRRALLMVDAGHVPDDVIALTRAWTSWLDLPPSHMSALSFCRHGVRCR